MNRKLGPHKSFWDYAKTYPPILVRILAKDGPKRPRSVEMIAEQSGMDPHKIRFLSMHTSWNEFRTDEMCKFLQGCGIDFCDSYTMHRLNVYLQNAPEWKYLRKSNEWQSVFEPMLKRYLNSLNHAH